MILLGNKYIPFHPASAEWAREAFGGVKNPVERFEALTKWVTRSIGYDFVKANQVAKQRGVMPDPAGCWMKRMGICQDTASLTVNMLRAVGIAAYMCIGHADRNYHAWVEATINGKTYRYDHDGKAKVYKRERVY